MATDTITENQLKHSTKKQSEVDRFWKYLAKSDNPDGCWTLREIKRTPSGYIVLQISGSRKKIRAHVLSWQIHNGPIPFPNEHTGKRGWFVCHKCDNRACVNPDHLFLGSNKDNIQDAANKGRTSRGEHRPNSRLKEEDIRAIMELLNNGERQYILAERYGIPYQHIQNIRKGRKWSHVTGIGKS